MDLVGQLDQSGLLSIFKLRRFTFEVTAENVIMHEVKMHISGIWIGLTDYAVSPPILREISKDTHNALDFHENGRYTLSQLQFQLYLETTLTDGVRESNVDDADALMSLTPGRTKDTWPENYQYPTLSVWKQVSSFTRRTL